ncbi:MAG TPA: hypothetical protein VIH61_04930, partial [Waddliaceae bacterium]
EYALILLQMELNQIEEYKQLYQNDRDLQACKLINKMIQHLVPKKSFDGVQAFDSNNLAKSKMEMTKILKQSMNEWVKFMQGDEIDNNIYESKSREINRLVKDLDSEDSEEEIKVSITDDLLKTLLSLLHEDEIVRIIERETRPDPPRELEKQLRNDLDQDSPIYESLVMHALSELKNAGG